MAEYDLPEGPRQLFDWVRRPLARAFGGEGNIRSAVLSDADRAIIRHLFGAIPAPRFYQLRTDGGVSLYEMARALHATRTRRADLVRWINRYAVRPQ